MASSETALLSDLAVVLLTAAVTTVVFHRLKLPTILGYLLAGVLVGPNLFGGSLLQDVGSIRTLATVGVVFLLFTVGLDFSLRRVASIGPFAFLAGALEVLLMLGIGFGTGRLLGWTNAESALLGAVLSISSTTIVVKLLTDAGRLQTERASVMFGILLVEDVAAVIMLALLAGYGQTGDVSFSLFTSTLAAAIFFIAAILALGLVVIPRVVDYVATLASNEVLVVSVVALLLGTSILAQLFGLTAALGAFLAGAVVSEARSSARVSDRITSLRDLFTAVFFVTMGMLVQPSFLLAAAPLVIAIVLVAILGKILVVTLATFFAGHKPHDAIHAGLGLAVVGEFSFVIADLGDRIGIARPELFPSVVAASAAMVLVAPLLVRVERPLEAWLGRRMPPALVTFAHLYGPSVRRLDALRGKPGVFRITQSHIVQLLLHAAALLALVFAAGWAGGRVYDRAPEFGVRASFAQLLVWAAFALAAVPFALAFVRRLDRLIHDLAHATTHDQANEPPTRFVKNSLRAVAVVVLGALFMLLLRPYLPPLPLLIVVLAALGLVLFLLWESIVRMNRRIETTLDEALGGRPAPKEEMQALRGIIETNYPWGVTAGAATVPAGGEAAGQSIRDLNLRRRTGASIVALDRGADRFVNPPPSLTLQPGDRVTVVGESDQVDSARDLLKHAATPGKRAPEARWMEVVIPTGSPFAGRTLAALRLRERTGATVVGLSRAGQRTPNPSPDVRVNVGDILLLVGSPEQAARARAVLLAGGEGDEEMPS